MKLNINTDAAVIFTNKLEKLRKSALPNAIRGALNKAAFNTKKDTLLSSAKNSFVQRQPNFFKANSRVEMAKGSDINRMRSTIGMLSERLKNQSTNFAVKDLEQQEHGGDIAGRSFLPLDPARGGNRNKNVKAKNRISEIRKVWKNRVVDASKVEGFNAKHKFVVAANITGSGGYVLAPEHKGRRVLWRIDFIGSSLKSRKSSIKKTALYSLISGFKAKVKGTGFMERASLESGNKIEDFYIQEAKRQINRI